MSCSAVWGFAANVKKASQQAENSEFEQHGHFIDHHRERV
jgi:hypothetical protein